MKFSGAIQLHTSKIWAGVSNPPGYGPGPKMACSLKNLSPPGDLILNNTNAQMVDYYSNKLSL
jgi:hypothetical protein